MAAPNRPSEEMLNHFKNDFRYYPDSGLLERYNRKYYRWQTVNLIRNYNQTTDKFSNPRVTVKIGAGGSPRTVSVTNICWYLHYGEWPPEEIDHIDTNGNNNKIDNLRLASSRLQAINKKTNKNLLPGVFTVKSKVNPFRATISVKGNTRHLGVFPTEILAHEAYRRAYKKIEGKELNFPYLEWHKPIVMEVVLSDMGSLDILAE